jgi:WD40 repeat protein
VEFQDDVTLVSCSRDGLTKFWDISTGTPKTEVPGENFTFSNATAGTEQRTGHFLVTAKDNLVLVYHADREANDGKKEAVAFFNAPSPVQSIACTGDQIGVGCKSGAVLHLRAPWLVEATAA